MFKLKLYDKEINKNDTRNKNKERNCNSVC